VLLVEDDEDLIACLRAVLEDERFSVVVVSDGASALEACSVDPLVALVDLHLPGEPSGPALVRGMRALLPPTTKVILLSAEHDLAAQAVKLGADGALEKPFELDQLLRLVGAEARRAAQDRQVPADPR